MRSRCIFRKAEVPALSLKCYNCTHELLDGRIDESGGTVFDCPGCGGENFALLDEKAGPDHFIITRVRTGHEIKFFLDCENRECRSLGYGVMPPPPDDSHKGEAPAIQTGPCPDCGRTRAFFVRRF